MHEQQQQAVKLPGRAIKAQVDETKPSQLPVALQAEAEARASRSIDQTSFTNFLESKFDLLSSQLLVPKSGACLTAPSAQLLTFFVSSKF